MTAEEIAIEAFSTEDMLTGSRSGGIEAPRIIRSVSGDSVCVDIHYTYPETCGLSDVRYHNTEAGKDFTASYIFDGEILHVLKDGLWSRELFGELWNEWERKEVASFCKKCGLRYSDVTTTATSLSEKR